MFDVPILTVRGCIHSCRHVKRHIVLYQHDMHPYNTHLRKSASDLTVKCIHNIVSSARN